MFGVTRKSGIDPAGVTILHDGGSSPVVDIIAIHGLNGGSESTWTDSGSDQKIMWLRDFLPNIFPDCRIMTYGFNADAMDGSEGTIRTHSRFFFESISNERNQEEEKLRPIIFLAHSLGGLVVKHALIECPSSVHYKPIYTATYGILFFGTPHRGSSKANFAAVLGRIAAAVSGGTPSRLIEALKTNSETLHTLNDSFSRHKFQIVSFFEGQPTSPLNDLVVDENSAKIGLHEEFEKTLQLNLSHCNLCKFSKDNDVNFRVVSKNIERFVQGAIKKKAGYGKDNTGSGIARVLTYPPDAFNAYPSRPGPLAIAPRAPLPPQVQHHPVKPVPERIVQLPKKKAVSLQNLKAEKMSLERQCHQFKQKLGEIGVKRKSTEAQRASFKSENADRPQQFIKDGTNRFRNELRRLENARVEWESKKDRAIKRLQFIEKELRALSTKK